MSPKISVIVPVYNVEKYLRECLDSIESQTLKDIEIICVNDGSTDSSPAILDEYAKKDARFKILSQENQGAGAARNTGLNAAHGEYLAILDSDDRYEPELLQKLLNLAEKDSLDIAICRSQALDDRTGAISQTPWTVRKEMMPDKTVFSYKDLSIYNFRFCVGWSWDKLFRRDFVERWGLRFQTLRSQNDALFVFVALVLAEKIEVLDNVLVTHRKNTGTQVSERRDRNPSCFMEAIRGIKKTLEEKGRFAEVEQSFDIWCVEHTIWQLNSLTLESQMRISDELTALLGELGVFGRPQSYYDKNQDEQLASRLEKLRKAAKKVSRLKKKIKKYDFLYSVTFRLFPVFLWRKTEYRQRLRDLLSGV